MVVGAAPDIAVAGPPAPLAETTFVWRTDCSILIIIQWEDFRADRGYFAVLDSTGNTINDTTMATGGLIDFGRARRSATRAYTLYAGDFGVGFTGQVRPFAAVFSPKANGGAINDRGDLTICPYTQT
jgi:hypothetical protein